MRTGEGDRENLWWTLALAQALAALRRAPVQCASVRCATSVCAQAAVAGGACCIRSSRTVVLKSDPMAATTTTTTTTTAIISYASVPRVGAMEKANGGWSDGAEKAGAGAGAVVVSFASAPFSEQRRAAATAATALVRTIYVQ